MNKLKLQLLCILLGFGLVGYAQTDSASEKAVGGAMTLQECIDFALENHTEIKNSLLEQQEANASIGEIRGVGLPQVNAEAQFLHWGQLQSSFFAGDNPFAQQFIAAEGGVPDPNKVYAFENLFQLPSTGDAKITVSQLIFDGQYIVGLQAAKAYRELSIRNTANTELRIKQNVIKAYYLVLINDARMGTLDANVDRLEKTIKELEAMYEQGFVEKLEVDRLKVTLNNLISEQENVKRLQQLGYLMLKFQMGMDLDAEMRLSENLDSFNSDLETTGEVDATQRSEWAQMEAQLQLANLDLKSEKFRSYPSVAAFANFGTNTASKSFDFYKFNNTWKGYNMFGIQASMPIFGGMQVKYRKQQKSLAINRLENGMEQFEQSVKLQAMQAKINYENAKVKLEREEANMELAEEVLRVTKAKYDQGVGSNLEVVTAETSLKEAQTNYYNAYYDVIQYKIDYQVATGTLE